MSSNVKRRLFDDEGAEGFAQGAGAGNAGAASQKKKVKTSLCTCDCEYRFSRQPYGVGERDSTSPDIDTVTTRLLTGVKVAEKERFLFDEAVECFLEETEEDEYQQVQGLLDGSLTMDHVRDDPLFDETIEANRTIITARLENIYLLIQKLEAERRALGSDNGCYYCGEDDEEPQSDLTRQLEDCIDNEWIHVRNIALRPDFDARPMLRTEYEAKKAAARAGAPATAEEELEEEEFTCAQRPSPVVDLTDASDESEASEHSYEGALDLRPRPVAPTAADDESDDDAEPAAPVPWQVLRRRMRLHLAADEAVATAAKALSDAVAMVAAASDGTVSREVSAASLTAAHEAARAAHVAHLAAEAAEAATEAPEAAPEAPEAAPEAPAAAPVTPESIRAQFVDLADRAANREEFMRSVMGLIDQTRMYELYDANVMRERLSRIYQMCCGRRADVEERAKPLVWQPPTPEEAARGLGGSCSGRVTLGDNVWFEMIDRDWMLVNSRYLLPQFVTYARTGRHA